MFINKNELGFSLVELMVVLAIFGIVTGVILNNAPRFRDKSSLELVAQNIALNIRGAQVYGIGTKVIEGQSTAPKSFGIHFNKKEKTSFLLFADLDNNGKFSKNTDNSSCLGECIESYELRGAKIQNIYICNGKTADCGLLTVSLVDIIYTRPQSEARFCIRENYSSSCENTPLSSIRIRIASAKEDRLRDINVLRNGQISVETPSS